MQDTTIWNSFLAWAMSTGTGNPPGSFFTRVLEFPGPQEGLAAQPAANTNLQIHWSFLNWLQVLAQLPQRGGLQLQGCNFMSRQLFCGGSEEKKHQHKFLRSLCCSCKRVHQPELNPVSKEFLLQYSSTNSSKTEASHRNTSLQKVKTRKLSCFKEDLG